MMAAPSTKKGKRDGMMTSPHTARPRLTPSDASGNQSSSAAQLMSASAQPNMYRRMSTPPEHIILPSWQICRLSGTE